MIRILYILSSTDSKGGATKAFMSMLAGLMTEKKVSPCVVLPSKQDVYYKFKDMGIPVLVTPLRMSIYPDWHTAKTLVLFPIKLIYWQWVNRKSVKRVIDFAERQIVQIIHTNVGVIDVGYRAAQQLQIPHIYHLREYGNKDFGMNYFPSRKFFIRQLQGTKSYSICITKDIMHYNKQTGSETSRVIYDAICPKQTSLTERVKKNYFFYAGRIEYAKGLDLLLQGYARYAEKTDEPWPLYIAGKDVDMNYSAGLKKFIQDKKLDYVRFLGELPDITKWMQEAKAIIIPSRFEGFGLCMTEAMFNGCLVIGNDTGGTHEQFENGLEMEGTEIGLRYETPEQLAEQLISLRQLPEQKYNDMIRRAFHNVNERYSIEANTTQMLAFYHIILSRN